MEFRLNKIETHVREKINSETREGKVHCKKGININKDKGHEERGKQRHQGKSDSEEKFSLSKYVKSDKKISIEAIKVKNIEIDATIEDRNISKERYKGVFLDTKK